MLIEQIKTGQYDNPAASDLTAAVSELTDPADRELVLTALKDIALKSDNMASVATSIRTLVATEPMEEGLEDALEIRALELIESRAAFSNRALQEAISEFLYWRIGELADHAEPFVDALIQFLDDQAGTGSTNTAYNTLMIVAANQPEYFKPHAGLLIRMLGSINKATRIQTARLISVLAMSHPEYVADAEKILSHLSSFNPDAELKNSASEALQILSSMLRPEEPASAGDMARSRQEPDTSGGLAEIMRRRMGKDRRDDSRINKRLLSMATNFARKADRAYKTDGDGAEQDEADADAINKIMDDFSDIAHSIRSETVPQAVTTKIVEEADVPATDEEADEAELRWMVEKVREDFSINVGNILNALGMGHMAKNTMTDGAIEDAPVTSEAAMPDHQKQVHLMRTEPIVRHEEEEDVSPKELVSSIESISRTEEEHADPAMGQADDQDAALAVPMPVGQDDATVENAAEATLLEPETETSVQEIVGADETDAPVELPDMQKSDALVETPPEQLRPAKSPIVPPGVRISAMKFRSIDQSKAKKTPTPPKISIKPHIKPLNKTPIDGVKVAPTRQHPLSTAPLAPRGLTPKEGSLSGEIICHSCNAKMPADSQRCAICGSDLKAPKVRCRVCGEINLRSSDKCSRCGSGIEE